MRCADFRKRIWQAELSRMVTKVSHRTMVILISGQLPKLEAPMDQPTSDLIRTKERTEWRSKDPSPEPTFDVTTRQANAFSSAPNRSYPSSHLSTTKRKRWGHSIIPLLN